MSLGIYLDDCTYDKELVGLLRREGYKVTTPVEAGMLGAKDPDHFRFAVNHGLTILTENTDDFIELHKQNPNHSGILLVYKENDPKKDMSNHEILRAINNVVGLNIPLSGQLIALNMWLF